MHPEGKRQGIKTAKLRRLPNGLEGALVFISFKCFTSVELGGGGLETKGVSFLFWDVQQQSLQRFRLALLKMQHPFQQRQRHHHPWQIQHVLLTNTVQYVIRDNAQPALGRLLRTPVRLAVLIRFERGKGRWSALFSQHPSARCGCRLVVRYRYGWGEALGGDRSRPRRFHDKSLIPNSF